MKVEVLNAKTAEVAKSITLNKEIFGVKPHTQAMFDVIVAQQASLRQGTSAVKDRSQVSGGGRKPWKQKGTGRARQGSIRAPQWYKGGVVFGPTIEANYKRKVNRKVYKLGIKSILSDKLNRKELIIIDDLQLETFSTKAALNLVKTLKLTNKKVMIVVVELNDYLEKSFANLHNVRVAQANQINPLLLIDNQMVVATESAIKKIEGGLQ